MLDGRQRSTFGAGRRLMAGCAAAVALVVAGCGGSTASSRIEALAEVLPATLEPTTAATGDPRVVKVRVWADAAVRKQAKWRDLLLEQVDAASQFWTPLFGVRIEVAGVREWDRKNDGTAALAELAAADPGNDVAWVIGYVAPDGTASISLSERGKAELLGHHVVISDWSPVPETAKLQEDLARFTEPERAEVLSAHRRHKQTVTLLHFLHLTLGAITEEEEAWIGSRGYSPGVRTVSERTRQLLAVALQSRLEDEELGEAAARLIDEIERAAGPSWVGAERDSTLLALRAIADKARAGKVADDVPRGATEQVERAKTLAAGKNYAQARAELDAVLVAYPANATIHLLRCEVLLAAAGAADADAVSACQRAAELAPAEPKVELAVARAELAAGARDRARARLVAALSKARALAAPAAPVAHIAEVYRAMGSITWAEEALAAAPAGAELAAVAQWAAGTRARYGIPRGATFVRPEEEHELVAAIRAALDAVYADKTAEAAKILADGSKRWPKAPGFAAVRCDLALRREQVAEAKRQCALALRGDDGQSWAHYLSGIVALRGPDTKGGIAHLRRAIALDPDLAQAWRALGKALERAKDQAGLAQLRIDYQARFSQPLP